MRESIARTEAFEYYYALGESRTLAKVAEKAGVSRASVDRWSVAFNWKERIKAREIEIAELLQEECKQEVVMNKLQYRKIIKAAMDMFQKKLLAGKVRVETIKDFELLLKSDLLLSGEATERSDISVKTAEDAREKLAGRLRSIAGRHRERESPESVE